jgi:glycosyltransferase involved in cell wall biosynthesis
MPKLAIIDQTVSAGGVERFLHGILEGMLELPEFKEWDVTILLNTQNSAGYKVKWPEHLTAPNVHVRYMFDDPLGRLTSRLARPERIWGIYGTDLASRSIPWLLRKYGTPWLRRHMGNVRSFIEYYCRLNKFDLLYFSWPLALERPRLNLPMVATPHDFNWKHKELGTVPPKTCKMLDRVTPPFLSACNILVVSSEFMANELRNFYPDCAEKVRLVRLGVPKSARLPSEAEVNAYRQRMGLPEQFLLTAGWIIPHKNQRVIIEALGRLRQINLKIPLVLVGPNSRLLRPDGKRPNNGYIQKILDTATKMGLRYGKDFLALGYVEDFELDCLYRLAAAAVQPSLYEAGSFPIAEAMRAGCPVACSHIPAHMEQASLIGDNIWPFDPHDPGNLADVIENMLADPQVTAERSRRAAEMVEQVYSWEKTAAGYLSVFCEALEHGINYHNA